MTEPQEYGLAVQVERDSAGSVVGLGLDDSLRGVAELHDGPTLDADITAIDKADFGIPRPTGAYEVEGEVATVRAHHDGRVEIVGFSDEETALGSGRMVNL